MSGTSMVNLPKERRTRKRLRLSCVECTRRRQKCDRSQPCGLCVSRGVAHLCRWENVPIARPSPRRPPGFMIEQTAKPNKEEELLSRIAALESIISRLQHNSPTARQVSSPITEISNVKVPPTPTMPSIPISEPHSSSSISSSPSPDPNPNCRSLVDVIQDPCKNLEAFTITAALAQVSLAHYGEYLGRGTVFSSLHVLSSPQGSSVQYAKSADAIYGFGHLGLDIGLPLFPSTISDLVSCLPSTSETIQLTQAFFTYLNWSYGIPESWFYFACGQMWDFLRGPQVGTENLNPHWLCLLFAVLASPPRLSNTVSPGVASSDGYLQYAIAAKRIAESACMAAPQFPAIESAADGVVLSCLATPLLADILFRRTLVSEAWKLVGNSIRAGQAVGLHLRPDSKHWCMMSETEQTLRTRAWWNLVVFDTMLSYKLSRPSICKPGSYDLVRPTSDHVSSSPSAVFDYHFIQLVEVVQMVMEKCMNPTCYPSGVTVFEADSGFLHWHAQLPAEFRDICHIPCADHRREAQALQMWYFSCRLRLHRTYLSHHGQASNPRAISEHPWLSKSRDLCINIASEILGFYCALQPEQSQLLGVLAEESCLPNSSIERVHLIFDAAVTIIIASTLLEPQYRSISTGSMVNQAILTLGGVAQMAEDGRREVARRSLEALKVLERGSHWRKPE